MEVILLETFDKLGQIGDIVKVKNGFARNYLIPNKKALRANKANKEVFQTIKKDLIEKNKQFVDESKSVLKKIENKEIVFIRNASDNGQLYGSVSPKDISNYFHENNLDIKPSNINLHSSIKKIGIYDLNIKLHAEVGCSLKINVAISEQAAKQQKLDIENELKKSKEKNDDRVTTTNKIEKDINDEDVDVKSSTVKDKVSLSKDDKKDTKLITKEKEDENSDEKSEKMITKKAVKTTKEDTS